jgi:general secretion pathway protein D
MNRRTHAQVAPGSALSKALFRTALLAALALTGLGGARLHAQSANSLYKSGQSAEAGQDYDAAFDFFQKANAKNPKDLSYRTALYRVRQTASSTHITKGQKLLQSGDEQGALSEFLHAAAIDPGNEAAQQAISHLRQKNGPLAPESEAAVPEPAGEQQDIDSISAPVDLKPVSNEPLTLHMTEDAKVIYQAIGKAAGVNVLFDPDYNSKRIQVDLNNVSLLDALRIVGTMSGTFWRPVTANTLFVAQNTRIKRTELDEQAVQTFYLSNAWQQNDLNDVQTALRNVLTSAKIYGVASQNAIVMRGTPDELLLAQKLINDLDKARAEVVVDIAVMEVSKNWERTLGVSWPSSIGVALTPPNATSSTTSSTTTTATTVSPTLYDLAHLKATNFAVTVGSATLNLLLSDSNTKVLQSPRIRATGDQKATMKIGSRIPIATGSYQTGAATAVVSSLVNTQFQYQDVGVNIEMTPTIHFDHDVTLKIKIEVTSQSGSVTISGVTEPILSQRVVDQVIRLREGEASILGGIQNNQEQQTLTGIPGLSSIPILKYIFGSKDHTIQNDEIVFVVVPHIVRSQELDQANLRAIDTGSGQSIDLRHSGDSSTSPAPAAAPAIRPIALQNSKVGTVPGQSAEAAAPALMSQMNAAAAQNPPSPAPVPQSVTPTPSAPAATPTAAPVSAPALPTSAASFTFTPPATPPTAGATFQVPVVLNGATDIASVPIQLQYDPARLTLINVAAGDLLNRDGQAVALIHRDDGPGNVTVVAARPPGAAGITGSGVVCILTFQAKSAGSTALTMTRAAAVNSVQQQVPATAGRIDLVVK